MNLNDVLKEASVIDHSWWVDGILQPGKPTFDAESEDIRKRNNVKPELEVEWGGAGPNVDLNEPAGVVERNIPEENLEDVDSIIVFARDMMNRGMPGASIVRELKAKFDQTTLKKAQSGLRKQFALDGIVGCIAVDGRGYKDCHAALKAASCSPYKHHIKYVIGCHCGDPQLIPLNSSLGIGKVVKSSGNAVDDFLGSEAEHKTAMVSHCRSTMLPILSFRGDLDPSEMDQSLLDLMNMSGLPEAQYQNLWDDRKNNKLSSNLGTIRAAFRWLNARKHKDGSSKCAQPVGPSEFQVGVADNPLDILPPPVADITDLDAAPGNVSLEVPSFESLDVEMDLFREPEFEGTDEVALNDVQSPEGLLDIDMRQDMEI
jgi:hypothetical protein